MNDWKEYVRSNERYEDFAILRSPSSFAEMFGGKDISIVQVHSIVEYGNEQNDIDIIFSGAFKWENNTLTPLDGDSYNKNMAVFAYEWFDDNETEEKGLDIIVGNDW